MEAHNIEDAVLAATRFFNRMYADHNLRGVLLEEVKEHDENHWDVTIGYSRLEEEPSAFSTLTEGAKYTRVYKVLMVEKETGTVKSMSIRTL